MSSQKPTKTIAVKSFRIFDFHIFDEFPSKIINASSTDDDDESQKPDDTRQFIIQLFGINETGKTCSIYITDFKPFFYVKVTDRWNIGDARMLLAHMKKTIGYMGKSILSADLEEHKQLYGFTAGKKYKFIKFVFDNTTAMNKTKNLWYEEYRDDGEDRKRKKFVFKNTELKLYESNIPPLLRYFHINNISPSGWIQIVTSHTKTPAQKNTTCDYEYVGTIKSIRPLNQKETRVPYKICSFDIEASSSHGDFPVPKKSYKRLATNLVDFFVQKFPDPIGVLNQCILSAFGYRVKKSNIDLVYPKIKPTKADLENLVQKFATVTIGNARKTANPDAKKILTIDSMFDAIAASSGGGGDEEVGGDGGDDAAAEEIVDAAATTPKPCVVVEEYDKNTILDILQGVLTRDEKIQITNSVLTSIFPPLEGDKVTFIGSTFMRYGETQPYMNHCLVLGTCDDVEGAIIETTATESELLLKWTDLIRKENPDIIIGYNIFGFDYEFMFRRAQENHCESAFLELSRKSGEICAKIVDSEYTIENTKVVLASGEYDLKYYKTTGRLQIDMYTYFRRDFNLASYKLDNVAGQFISDDIKKITHELAANGTPTTHLYSQNLTGLNKHDYIHIEISGFTSDYYQDGKKFQVLDIIDNSIIVIKDHHNLPSNIKWGMAKDDVSPQDIFRLSNGSASDRAIVAKYCIQDCNLVHHLLNKIDVITGYVEMSRICSVPISFLVFRGQGIKLTSYVAKKCREKGTLMPDLEKTAYSDGYEGAIVLPPKCSMYMDNPVACVDYSSLYPSSMISNNLSHDSKVWTKEYDLQGNLVKSTGDEKFDNLPEYQYVDIEFDTFQYVRKTPTSKAVKVKSGTKKCRWAQLPDNQKSIMPAILEELLKARSDTRKLIKTEKDPFMQNILDKRQLGYKVTANSLYGQCGARTSTFFEQDVAASTTATGRMMIIYARSIIEEVYKDREYNTDCHGPVLTKAEYIYGDSVANYTPVYIRVREGGGRGGSVSVCEGITISVCAVIKIIEIQNIVSYSKSQRWLDCVGETGRTTKQYCEFENIDTWTEKGWTPLQRAIRHKLDPQKSMWRVMTPTGIIDVTSDHSLLTSDGIEISPEKAEIGTELLHHSPPQEGWVSNGDFACYDTTFKTQHEAQWWYNSLRSKGFMPELSYNEKSGMYKISVSPESEIIYPKRIYKKIKLESKKPSFVYDLTTENHHFAAGIGELIVHNTDSVFFTFNLQDPITHEKIRGKKALEITIEIAQDAAKLCTDFLKPPMALAYEKTLMPFILLSKKRYVGMLYEENPNKGKLKYMGLAIKRRDSCDYLKDVYGEILNILMKTNDLKQATDFLDRALNELVSGKVPMEKLMITRALRSDYKNPQQIAHKVLADRIAQRDPGNKPKSGDRMKFVFIENPATTKKTLLGDRIETPEFIVSNGLKIDYNYYITNQLMKPLQQLFGLALEQIWESQKKLSAIKTYKQEIAKLNTTYTEDYELFMKKKEKYCADKVKVLLFDGVLQKITNEKNKVRPITDFFS